MAGTDSVPESPGPTDSLRPLFKITEVFLWDRAKVTAVPEDSDHLDNLVEEPTTSYMNADIKSNIDHAIYECTSFEDFELAKEMDALGLPMSFSTTKQKNGARIKGKIKAKCAHGNTDIENRAPGELKSCILENSSSRVLHDSTNISLSGTESNYGDASHVVYEGPDKGVLQLDRESRLPTALGVIIENQVNNDETDVITNNCAEDEFSCHDPGIERNAVLHHLLGEDAENFPKNKLEDANSLDHCEVGLFHGEALDNYVDGSSVSSYITGANIEIDYPMNPDSCPISMDLSLSCAPSDHHVPDSSDSLIWCEFGDWRVIWDPFYKRNYFYNFQSQESTWYPPPGLEQFAQSTYISNELPSDTHEGHTRMEFSYDPMGDMNLCGAHGRTSFFKETQDDPEYLNSSSKEANSSRMSNDITATFVSACSGEDVNVRKNSEEEVSLPRPMDYLTDDGEKQGKHLISAACSALDVPCEHFVSNSLTETVSGQCSNEDGNASPNTSVASLLDKLESHQEIISKKKKRRVRRVQPRGDDSLSADIVKYWCQRYLLFSKFDKGIQLDEEGWFSVTPEAIASHHASRCGSGVIIDCFTGVAGNAIQFAKKSNHVMAIDIDPEKIDCAQHNADIYGVRDRINFIIGDFFHVAPRLKADVVFLSPPWGGPDYNKVQAYDIRMLKPRDGEHLFNIAKNIASKVVMFLPRNVDINQLVELSQSVDPPWALEVERNFLNGRLKAITAYFDDPTVQRKTLKKG